MSTRRHAFASMGRRAAALAACMALVAGLVPYAPARAEEAASQAPAAEAAPSAPAAQALSALAQEEPALPTVLEAQAQTASIAVKTAPAKTAYVEGERFDPAGLFLAVTLTDGTTYDVAYTDDTKDSFSFDKTTLAATDTSVTIAYGGKAVTLPITVSGTANCNKYIITPSDETKSAEDTQTKTLAIDGVEVTATLTDSDKSIDGLAVARRASASDAITSALGGRTVQGDWDVSFGDGATEGFGTLTLTFPASGETAQVWEVHNGNLSQGSDQAVSNSTASATTTTLSEFAVVSAPDAAQAIPRTGDGSGGALPALPLAAAGAALAALAAGRRRRTDSRR